MDELVDELLDLIDDIKRYLSDQKYIDIMKALTKLYNSDSTNTIVNGCITAKINDYGYLELTWKDINGKVHRDGGPAEIRYYKNGKLQRELWFKEGKLHRDDLPAATLYSENGQIRYKEWYRDGNFHRDDLPAIIRYNDDGQLESELWLQDGKKHRDDLPAVITYYENGQLLSEYWFQDGKHHREGDLPAVISYYENAQIKREEWYLGGKMHRDDADLPVRIQYDATGQIQLQWRCKDGMLDQLL